MWIILNIICLLKRLDGFPINIIKIFSIQTNFKQWNDAWMNNWIDVFMLLYIIHRLQWIILGRMLANRLTASKEIRFVLLVELQIIHMNFSSRKFRYLFTIIYNAIYNKNLWYSYCCNREYDMSNEWILFMVFNFGRWRCFDIISISL